MADHDPTVNKLADRAPGFEEKNPYEGVDVSELPDWWQDAIEEFDEHDLRPYRPPRFTDQEYLPETVTTLENELDISIRVMGINVSFGDDWGIFVNGERVSTIGRRRDPAGYTVFEMTSVEFEEIVRNEFDCEQ